jgi:hypothetical protein
MCVVNNRFVDEEKKKIGLLYIMVGRRIPYFHDICSFFCSSFCIIPVPL